MNNIFLVYRMQFATFRREKGMAVFYALSILASGLAAPIFMQKAQSSLIMAATFTAIFLKPLLADSMAGEREHKTLETLLSTPISGKKLALGKACFCVSFALGYFFTSLLLAALTSLFLGHGIGLTALQRFAILVIALLNFTAICLAGVYASATSADMPTANQRVARASYILGFVFLIFLSLIGFGFSFLMAFTGVLTLFYTCIISLYTVKIFRMRQYNFFENVKARRKRTRANKAANGISAKSQFGIVFGFELKYMLTLKALLLNFAAICFAPALIACLLPSSIGTDKIDLNHAVFMTILLIPRVPTNLIAVSIGGEKAYKTGESLLSTPLSTLYIFLAKCAVPVLVSGIMLVFSSLVTLVSANLMGRFVPSLAVAYQYSAAQLVMLLLVGISSALLMIFLSAIFSVALKTPRHGLYVSSILSFLFAPPILAIMYWAQNMLLWAVLYAVALLFASLASALFIAKRISRPQIMGRL